MDQQAGYSGDDTATLRPRGKNWGEYFASPERADLPPREQPPLDKRKNLQ